MYKGVKCQKKKPNPKNLIHLRKKVNNIKKNKEKEKKRKKVNNIKNIKKKTK